ncbi:MAG: glycosyltransferase family 4 protein [Parcubacteria group bacterium]|nr:glycosyltransferase family 4 protein [Parcubacteria group bacterium]
MRILIDLRLLTKGGTTGIEEYTMQLITHLLDIDRKNEYLFFYNGIRKAPLPQKWLSRPNVGLANWYIPNKLFDAASFLFDQPKIDSFLKAGVIFSPHFNIISHTPKMPHAMTFHDLSFVHHPEFFPKRKQFWHWLQRYRQHAKSADRIIAVSEFTKWDLAEEFGIAPGKITTIYSGISSDLRPMPRTAPELELFAERMHLRRPFLLYLGTVEPRKNVSAAIRAFNILKSFDSFRDWQLVIAGNLGWLYQGVLREAGNSPYKRDIRFLGKVSVADKALLYNLAEIFIYPSFFEGFGFPPLEAQACGIPVIAADRTSLPEILGHSAELVNPWKIDDIVFAIRDFSLNRGKRERFISAGLENAKKFSWEKTASETLKCLEKAR